MRPDDFDRFSALIQGVADCYGQTLTAQGMVLRFKMLEHADYGDVEKAALSIMASRKYSSMPTPADFIEHIGGGRVEDQAEVEAGKVLDAVGRVGGYASVAFDDAVTQAVIAKAYGGWPKLCETIGTEEDEQWFRKNFAKTWGAYCRQGIVQHGHLPGRSEIGNGSNGLLHTEQIRLVGDKAKAQAILEAGRQEATVPQQLSTSAIFEVAKTRAVASSFGAHGNVKARGASHGYSLPQLGILEAKRHERAAEF